VNQARRNVESVIRETYNQGQTFTSVDIYRRYMALYGGRNSELTMAQVRSIIRGITWIENTGQYNRNHNMYVRVE